MDRSDVVVLVMLTLIVISPLGLGLASTPSNTVSTSELSPSTPSECQPSPGATSTYSGDPPHFIGHISWQDDREVVRINFSRVRDDIPPDGVMQVRFGNFAEVVDQSGFTEPWNGTYNWDRTGNPWIEYRITPSAESTQNINLTPSPSPGQIIPLPNYGGKVLVSFEPAEAGYLGANFGYLGAHESFSSKAGCQNITLIQPKAANLSASPENVLSVLNDSAYRFPLGSPYRQIRVFIYPNTLGDASGFVQPSASEDSGPDIIVEENASLEGPKDFTYRHEYIHTRLGQLENDSMEWYDEAAAEYYSYRLALANGTISPRQYDAILGHNYMLNYDGTLAQDGNSDMVYARGPVVLSQLDHELRTNNNETLVSVTNWTYYKEHGWEGVTPEQFSNRLGLPSKSGINITQQIHSSNTSEPTFLLGPSWLPNIVRILWLPAIGTWPIINGIYGLFVFAWILSMLNTARTYL